MAGHVPPGWPEGVHPPGSEGFERTAVAWLLDAAPPEYRLHGVLRRHPVALAALVRRHLNACVQGAREGYRTARTELGDALPAHALEAVLAAYRSEGQRLVAAARAADLLARAMRGEVFAPRLRDPEHRLAHRPTERPAATPAGRGAGERDAARQGAGKPAAARQGAGEPTAARQGARAPAPASQRAGKPAAARQGAGKPAAASQGAREPAPASQDAADQRLAPPDRARRDAASQGTMDSAPTSPGSARAESARRRPDKDGPPPSQSAPNRGSRRGAATARRAIGAPAGGKN